MRVELRFQYTIDDLRDALKPEQLSKRRVKPSPRWQVITISIIALPALAAALYFGWHGEARNNEPLPPVHDVLFLMGSSFVPAIIIVWAMLIPLRRNESLLRRSRKPEEAAARPKKHYFGGILFAVGSMIWTLLIFMPSFAVPWEPSRAVAVLIGVLPWVFVWVLAVVSNRITHRRSIEIQWNSKPTWRRDKMLVLDDDEGYVIRDDVITSAYGWSYFPRARETEIALLLHDEEGRVHIIPKRAFADEVAIARARWMIEQHVKNVQFMPQTSAFPVVTAPPVSGVPDPASGPASPTPSTTPN